MSTTIKLTVMADATGEPAGFDSTIITLPDAVYATVDGERCLIGPLIGHILRQASEACATQMGKRLHHAEWTLTSDPDEVRTLGTMHDCATCRAGVDQAHAYLRDNPDGEVAVGQLWWA